jgi:hypothetical protein
MKFPRGPVVRVHCRKELITKAITANSTKCWIAEAIKEAVPNATGVAVDVATARFSDLERGLRYVYLTPYAAQKALLDFDEGKPPAPFSFLLRNAHVTRAGLTTKTKSKRAAAAAAQRHAALAKTTIVKVDNAGSMPRRVGGRRPPQLRHLRQFGVRAFRGASTARLQADREAADRADQK